MARLWDTNLADKAAAMDQALKLGGIVISPPKVTTGFSGAAQPPRPPEPPR